MLYFYIVAFRKKAQYKGIHIRNSKVIIVRILNGAKLQCYIWH